MRTFRIASTLLLLALLALSHAAAAQGDITVTGHVKGKDGNPKQFSSVSFDGPGRYAAATNAEGVFTISGVKPGKYTIRVRQGDRVAEFYRDVGDSIELIVSW